MRDGRSAEDGVVHGVESPVVHTESLGDGFAVARWAHVSCEVPSGKATEVENVFAVHFGVAQGDW